MTQEEVKIRGEYWIQDSYLQSADSQVDGVGHDGIAAQHICDQFASSISDMAQDLDIEERIDQYDGSNTEELQRVLSEISEKLQEQGMNEKQAELHIMQTIDCDRDAYRILHGGGYASFYAMKHLDWIAVRSNNIELFGYNDKKRRQLLNGLDEIFDSEGIDKNLPPDTIEFSIHDHKTKKSSYITMADIENPIQAARTNQALQTTYNKPMWSGKDSEENKYQNPAKSKSNQWTATAQKTRVIGPGQQLWRGTSESVLAFADWLKLRESRKV